MDIEVSVSGPGGKACGGEVRRLASRQCAESNSSTAPPVRARSTDQIVGAATRLIRANDSLAENHATLSAPGYHDLLMERADAFKALRQAVHSDGEAL
jgi:hypothetical protein